MKKRLFIIVCLLLATLLFAGCDKLESSKLTKLAEKVFSEFEETEKEEKEEEEPEEELQEEKKGVEQKEEDETIPGLDEAGRSPNRIQGGTNQSDAVYLPMNTKLYGTASNEQGQWYAFTTGENEKNTYKITGVNKYEGDDYRDPNGLSVYIYDEFGEELEHVFAKRNGVAATISTEELFPNTMYYVRVVTTTNTGSVTDDIADFMMMISDSEEQTSAYGTTGSMAEARGTSVALDEEIYPGTNQDDAAFIPADAKVSGTVRDGASAWYAITTGENEDVYDFIAVNRTVGSDGLTMFVYDKYGEEIDHVFADEDGVAARISLDKLLPNTNYYIRISSTTNTGSVTDETVDYALNIKSAQLQKQTQTATVEKEELVFETPFEINQSQVMFVANKAVFIDENAAKNALNPIAEVILAHPEHPILLAGTTAQDGSQEVCVTLSNKRADAVKQLLVGSFGVPESQILTVGLGYEADPFVRGKDRDANGNFVETEGAKNRRVVVLDAEDPIAKTILNK